MTGLMDWARGFYRSSDIGRLLLHPFKLVLNNIEFNVWTDRAHIKRKFAEFHSRQLNLTRPVSFSEKIQWLKLYDRTPLHTACADKFKVREYVQARIGADYLIPLLCTVKDSRQLDFSRIPGNQFVIKTNHDSGTVIIVRDKDDENIDAIRERLNSSMNINFYHSSREWQYKNIVPIIMVESFLSDVSGEVPKDYKIHCFSGEPQFIQVDSDRFVDHGRAMYDTRWNELDFTIKFPHAGGIPRPATLEEMLSIAARLSQPFRYARIDLYEVDGSVYFGEITFHPGSGFEVFKPLEWDVKMGEYLRL